MKPEFAYWIVGIIAVPIAVFTGILIAAPIIWIFLGLIYFSQRNKEEKLNVLENRPEFNQKPIPTA